MIGKAVTSNSCIGTCLIFSMARQPKASDATSGVGRGGRVPVDSDRPQRLLGEDGFGLGDGHAASSWCVAVGGMAGEGQEDLVEAGLAERELGDGDAGASQRGQWRRPPARGRRRRADSAAGSGSSCTA